MLNETVFNLVENNFNDKEEDHISIEKIKSEILNCILKLCSNKKLVSEAYYVDFSVEVPREKAFGELSTNVALLLGKIEKRNPRKIAEMRINGIPNKVNSTIPIYRT